MKRQIRSSVFETNSSSVHSIVYSKEGMEPSKFKLNKYGQIEVDFGSFDNSFRLYDTQYDKLSYLITCLWYMVGTTDDIYNDYQFSVLENAVCEYTGAAGIKIIDEVEPYIDHQSQPEYDIIDIINIYDKEEVQNFIFNKNIYLKTDCD